MGYLGICSDIHLIVRNVSDRWDVGQAGTVQVLFEKLQHLL